MPRTPRRASIAPSYRLSNLDVSQLADDLSVVVPQTPSPVKQSSAAVEHDKVQRHAANEEDPFGDDTYAIGDEEVDDIVHALRNSGEIAEDSTARSSHSFGHDTYAIGDDEVDEIVSALRRSSDNSRVRNRQALNEDADE